MVFRGGTIINISGNTPVDDPEYRYKMPAVFGKIEGSGNGIKTTIPNITAVGLSLHRSPGEVNKFFGTELGAQTRYNADTDRAIVNGVHTDAVLQELMHRYIEKFVLCPNCGLPETEYKIKNDCIYHKCAACGAKELVDMSHKLCNYILAENKKTKKEKGSSSKKDDKKKKDKRKDKSSEGGGGSDEDKKKKDKKDKDKKKDKKSSSSKKKDKDGKDEAENGKDYINDALFGKKHDDGLDVDDDDDDGSDDVSDDVAASGGVDDEGALDLAVDATRKYIAEKGGPKSAAAAPKVLVELVTNQQMASALKAQDKVTILALASITPSTFFKEQEIATFAPTFALLVIGNRIMERHLIAALEVLCVNKTNNFPVMLKQFYDEDVLSEEVILEWADDGRSEYTSAKVDEEVRAMLRAEAEPIVAWLQEADSDDDDEDGDESEED